MMPLKQKVVAQFMRPQGFWGQVAGFIMANRPSNIKRNEWTLDLLKLKPTDHLLEVGFGPGVAIKKASRIITKGSIAGIDHSETMLAQASKLNSDAIQCGTVELYLGTVEELPAFARPFDKIFSANVVQFWRDPVATFKKLRSLLAPSGIIATTYMARNKGATNADTHAMVKEIIRQLQASGFSSIRVEEKQMNPVSVASVLAVNGVE